MRVLDSPSPTLERRLLERAGEGARLERGEEEVRLTLVRSGQEICLVALSGRCSRIYRTR